MVSVEHKPNRKNKMFKACDVVYFEIGDVVVQKHYVGAPAKVVGVSYDKITGKALYELEVDVSNHPEGFDQNGERVQTSSALVWGEELAAMNEVE